MQKFYFVRYEFGAVLAQNQNAACQAVANHNVIEQECKVLVVVAPKANTQIFPDLSQKEIMTRIVYLQLAIIWTVADYEQKASELEKGAIGSIYDRKLFEQALVKMIEAHSKEKGITWKTVEFYLNKYCKID